MMASNGGQLAVRLVSRLDVRKRDRGMTIYVDNCYGWLALGAVVLGMVALAVYIAIEIPGVHPYAWGTLAVMAAIPLGIVLIVLTWDVRVIVETGDNTCWLKHSVLGLMFRKKRLPLRDAKLVFSRIPLDFAHNKEKLITPAGCLLMPFGFLGSALAMAIDNRGYDKSIEYAPCLWHVDAKGNPTPLIGIKPHVRFRYDSVTMHDPDLFVAEYVDTNELARRAMGGVHEVERVTEHDPVSLAETDETEIHEVSSTPRPNLDDALAECRSKFGEAPRSIPLTMRFGYLHIRRPIWSYLDPKDEIRHTFRHAASTFRDGIATWGYVVQANAILYRRGDLSAPGELVYSLEDADRVDPDELANIAYRLGSLKGTAPSDPALKPIADYLTDELIRVYGLEVPETISPNMRCRVSTTYFYRPHLAGRVLSEGLLPVVVREDMPHVVLPLPPRYWSRDLIDWWLDGRPFT